jgi:hypothetical protein
LYGNTVDKLRLESKTFTTPTNRKVEINMISSNSHIEMTPSDAGIYDRFVIGTVLKEIASNAPLFQSKAGVPFKVREWTGRGAGGALTCPPAPMNAKPTPTLRLRPSPASDRGPQRGGQPDQAGAGRPEEDHGKVHGGVPPRPGCEEQQ